VIIAEERVHGGLASAVLVNSGNANACTGKAGHRVTLSTTAAVAGALGCAPSHVLPASTGVIGHLLPGERVVGGIPQLVRSLGPDGADAFARSILTTDRGPKLAWRRVSLGGGRRATVLAIAKGAGMIHPDMATTLAFVLTDAPVSRSALKRLLRTATDETFNRITVDDDTSTNDTILALASGAVGGPQLPGSGRVRERFARAFTDVLEDVAKLIVADGEGAERLVKIVVRGALNDKAALRVARTVATSQLVKTAIHGRDPNWGRLLAAAGRSGVSIDERRVNIRVGGVPVYSRGRPVGEAAEVPAATAMDQAEYAIELRLGAGEGQAHYWTCDLGHEYVRINADYRT